MTYRYVAFFGVELFTAGLHAARRSRGVPRAPDSLAICSDLLRDRCPPTPRPDTSRAEPQPGTLLTHILPVHTQSPRTPPLQPLCPRLSFLLLLRLPSRPSFQSSLSSFSSLCLPSHSPSPDLRSIPCLPLSIGSCTQPNGRKFQIVTTTTNPPPTPSPITTSAQLPAPRCTHHPGTPHSRFYRLPTGASFHTGASTSGSFW